MLLRTNLIKFFDKGCFLTNSPPRNSKIPVANRSPAALPPSPFPKSPMQICINKTLFCTGSYLSVLFVKECPLQPHARRASQYAGIGGNIMRICVYCSAVISPATVLRTGNARLGDNMGALKGHFWHLSVSY